MKFHVTCGRGTEVFAKDELLKKLKCTQVDQIDGKVFFDLSDQQDLDEIASLRTMERVFVTVVHLPTPDLRGQGKVRFLQLLKNHVVDKNAICRSLQCLQRMKSSHFSHCISHDLPAFGRQSKCLARVMPACLRSTKPSDTDIAKVNACLSDDDMSHPTDIEHDATTRCLSRKRPSSSVSTLSASHHQGYLSTDHQASCRSSCKRLYDSGSVPHVCCNKCDASCDEFRGADGDAVCRLKQRRLDTRREPRGASTLLTRDRLSLADSGCADIGEIHVTGDIKGAIGHPGHVTGYGGGVAVATGGVAIGTADVAICTGGVAIDAEGVAIDNGGVAIDTGGVAICTGGVAMDAGGVAIDNGRVAINTGGVAIGTGGVAMDNGGVAIDTGGVAIGTGGVAMDAGGVAIDNGGVAIDTGGVAIGTGGVAINTVGVAVDTAGVAVGTGSVAIGTGGVSMGTGGLATDTGGVAKGTVDVATDIRAVATYDRCVAIGTGGIAIGTAGVSVDSKSTGVSVDSKSTGVSGGILSCDIQDICADDIADVTTFCQLRRNSGGVLTDVSGDNQGVARSTIAAGGVSGGVSTGDNSRRACDVFHSSYQRCQSKEPLSHISPLFSFSSLTPSDESALFGEVSFRFSVKCAGWCRRWLDVQRLSKELGIRLSLVSGWSVDLINPSFEICVHINDEHIVVGIPVYRDPLSKRSYVLVSGLRSTVCCIMSTLADIQPGNTVLDPMAGKGTILIEAAKGSHVTQDCVFMCCDVDTAQLEAAMRNVVFASLSGRVHLMQANALNLPLHPSSVDRIVCDAPFGSKHTIPYCCLPHFYLSILTQFHRVLKSDGLVVLLTSQELLPIIEDICPHRSAANQSSFESPTSLLPQTHPKRMATSQTDGHNSNGWPHPKLLATPVSYPVVPSHMEDSRASHIKPDSIQCGLNDSTANSLWRTPSRRWMFVCGKLTDTCPPPLLAGSSAMGDSRHFALVSKHYVKLGNTDAVIVKLQKSL